MTENVISFTEEAVGNLPEVPDFQFLVTNGTVLSDMFKSIISEVTSLALQRSPDEWTIECRNI